ncbi:hypothetical protein LSCM1_07997 [Leishmania martiniquensis]|uniref:Uncharacterized protein n=1 Tax=Leishmania martiniquensis TaxID=1580590 RepID=A0A836KV12_9TRYP|nr:hypothetical protein LSCM1_07997 [Leishmania martiniquensis]
MDVAVGTIVSRFAFTLPRLCDDSGDGGEDVLPSSDDEGTVNSCDVAYTSATCCDEAPASATPTRTGAGSRDTQFGASASKTENVGATGAYAFVPDGRTSASASLTASSPSPYVLGRGGARSSGSDGTATAAQRGDGDRRGGAMRRGALPYVPNLLQLATRAWNVELCRGPTGSASHCVLRLPPFVDGTSIYRSPVVYVLASGVVRLMTHGSVAATEVVARRVRAALHEACTPLAVRRAAREESRLLRAVLDDTLTGISNDKDEDEDCARRLRCVALHAEVNLSSSDMSLATALAGEAMASGAHGRKAASAPSPATASTRPLAGKDEGRAPSALAEKICTIDFVQAVATPRWDEIAGLRAALFAPDSDALVKEDGGGAIAADEHRAVEETFRVSVRRASVNVRGDAPMEWWRWYLDVQAGLSDDAANEEATAAHTLSKAACFRTCAGHAGASPTAATKFVSFLLRRRALLAHHIRSFKLRRQATQNSLQILLDWRTATPLPPPAPPLLSAAAAAAAPQSLVGRPLSAEASLSGKLRAVEEPLPDAGTPTALAAPTRVSGGGAWVTEASAANFFMDSTFIAESTAPYRQESVRMPRDNAEPAEPAPLASRASGDETPGNSADSTAYRWDGGRDGKSAFYEHHSRPSNLRRDKSQTDDDTTTAKAAPAKRKRVAVAPGTAMAKRAKAAATTAVVEHVTCLIHRTGRVQMTAASELALRQMCALLLIPFLVATADVE